MRTTDPTLSAPADADAAPPPLARSVVWLFAAMAGLAVANLYYHQPLLGEIARGFGTSERQAGQISTVTQVGYAAGLLLFVPLADVRERRALVVWLLLGVALALTGAALAPSLGWLAAASLLIGLTTVVPQVIVPFAAGLAAPAQRGRVIGQVVGGLLVGILGARVVSGALGEALGWRMVFALAALLMLALALLARRALPAARPAARLGYAGLLRSLLPLLGREPVLREAAWIGAASFGAFSAFWTTLAFRLQTPPLDYGPRVAGLFGLVGIVGALAAPAVGRLIDRVAPHLTLGAGLVTSLAGYLLFLLFGGSLLGLAAGVVVLDAGAQLTGISNQARIYALSPELHGRLNTVYMASFFVGGAAGSLLGTLAWGARGWAGVCGVGLALLTLALGGWLRYGGVRRAAAGSGG